MDTQRRRERIAVIEALFTERDASVLLPEERARLELAGCVLAALPSLWLWALATVQLRSGHVWQWPAAMATAAFTVFFGLRALFSLQQLRRFARRAQLLAALGETRITLQPAPNAIRITGYSKAVRAVVIARLLAELGWLLERPTNHPLTIFLALATGGATMIIGALWLAGLAVDLSEWVAANDYQLVITDRPALEGSMKVLLVSGKIDRPSAIVATLSVPSGGRFLCHCDAKENAVAALDEAAYELELRLDKPRQVPWSYVGDETATLELLVQPGVTVTFALGLELDAFRPQRAWY